MKVHFIAIGGSAMHNLAIALHKKGVVVSGSDDEVFEPSKSRLAKYNLLPEKEGWDSNNIQEDLDAVILGMHAREDNPELLKAKDLGLKIYSYPEYLYEQSKEKIRVVIGGSHGKTSITSMVLHVLHFNEIACDYMVGAQLEGFDTMVKLSDAPIIILEGDEYLSSPIDRRPKFHLYRPSIALLSGIAWDHINVFPTFENYVEQFKIFVDLIEPGGSIIYCELDENVKRVGEAARADVKKYPYNIPLHKIEKGITYLINENEKIPLKVFGEHNLMNLEGARLICEALAVSKSKFYAAISSFSGASKRLELLEQNNDTAIYRDFAHSPSKLKATTEAVKKQYPERKLIACMELHTFSSLNENFLKEYDKTMIAADEAIVYFNPMTIAHKKLKAISAAQVLAAFGGENVKVFTEAEELVVYLKNKNWKESNLLMMSSGNFNGMDLQKFAKEIIRLT